MRVITILLIAALTSACGFSGPPKITTFTATPENFCSLPRTIGLDWQVVGSDTQSLSSSPTVPGLPADPGNQGSTSVSVSSDSTTFTYSGTNDDGTTREPKTVQRLSGTRDYALGSTNTSCVGGRLQYQVSVLEDEYSREVVVRSLRAPVGNLMQIDVQGPGGTANLAAGGVEVLFTGPLVGTWTITQTVVPRCAPTSGTAGLVGLLAKIGCP